MALNPAMDALNERIGFAEMLVMLVRQRCADSGSNRTSRTGLHLRVPVDERPSVRRGLDALIEHGVLGTSGGDIGLTLQGRAFLAYCRRLRGEPHGPGDLNDLDTVHRLVTAIEDDERLDSDQTPDEVRTLPGRLEEHRERKRSGSFRFWVMLAVVLAVLCVVLLALPPR
ncbi:hypothetical protein [Variovorax sp.]|uniref:hypothetical protein n=1 Tax=Variovorax sp. TaxID=1871043 RepID=UPI002D6C30DE|nr:hypothetical protein [Variovorax sp.]HYP85610.1 hypothetical protein [Variovorax sp.]